MSDENRIGVGDRRISPVKCCIKFIPISTNKVSKALENEKIVFGEVIIGARIDAFSTRCSKLLLLIFKFFWSLSLT